MAVKKKSNPKGESFEIEEILLCIFLTLMFTICTLQVFFRYVLQNSLSWSEEAARYIFIWLVWLGAAYATKKGRLLCVSFVKESLPEKYHRAFDVFSMLMTIAFSCTVGYISIELIKNVYKSGQSSPAMNLPMWIPYLAVPLGLGLITFRAVQNIVLLYRPGKAKPENQDDEVIPL